MGRPRGAAAGSSGLGSGEGREAPEHAAGLGRVSPPPPGSTRKPQSSVRPALQGAARGPSPSRSRAPTPAPTPAPPLPPRPRPSTPGRAIMVVLKGVPALLSPELLYALARMGHGDEIVFADVNFPTSSICRCGPEEIRADGLGIPELLEAVLKMLPLDTYVESPSTLAKIERFEFYARAKKAFAVVATGETALYGNLILKKGVLAPEALF
ncbi:fucose mutarotase isoform X5 [Mirounga angustirostris]|uniref:fucose mutarotase isoform X5 n=1 Tax=Mirounga angustirostris TaxID=9716 RepID=UPI001E68D1E6|nr:fucose mutarotase isoform X5 [Mirounga angustirostris]